MAYSVPSGWLNSIKKQLISNANVYLYDENDDLVISKSDISNFQYKGRNSWVCKEYPSYEIQFTILNWTNYAYQSSVAKGLRLYLCYVIESYQTTDNRVYYIYDQVYDFQKDTMTIKAHSPLQELTSNVSVALGSNASTLVQDISTKQDYIDANLDLDYSGVDNDFTTDYIPQKITDGELLQHLALSTNCALLLYNTNQLKLETIMNVVSTVQLDEINMLSKVESYISDLSSDVAIADWEDSAIALLGTTQIKTGNSVPVTMSMFYYYNEGEMALSQISPAIPETELTTLGGASVAHTPYEFNDCIEVRFSPNTNTTYVLKVNGKNHSQTTKQDNSKTMLSLPLVDDDTQKNDIINYVSDYYDMNEILSFECRIDPRIEPLDLIYVESVHKFIYVEEVTITFNGGFRGTIKGRYNYNMTIIAPVVSEVQYDENGQFFFKVTNRNIYPVHAYLHYSGGTKDLGITNAGSYKTYTHSTLPDLVSSFREKALGGLDDTVYIWYESGEFISTNTIIIEAD